ncbi:hypothetical protein F4815DRAFT_212632 [Daldinia loculata]|nr:hypothetical protein F4815DRAFT_212632 [Daldinia loculata]
MSRRRLRFLLLITSATPQNPKSSSPWTKMLVTFLTCVTSFEVSWKAVVTPMPRRLVSSSPRPAIARISLDKLNAFQPVQKTVNEHTVLLTPNGDCLLNLTEEEAELFLELQDRIRADSALPTAFSAPRHTPATGFSLVKNRAVPNGTPSYFPSGPDNYPSDPVGKMHREEAISCINQHVLPSLNLSGYKAGPGGGPSSTTGRNVNLQQLAPWICPSVDNAEERGKMFGGRAGDEFVGGGAGGVDYTCHDHVPGVNANGGPAIGSAPLMSVEDAEAALVLAKKQHEVLDKKFRQLQARNRRLVGLH